MNFDMIIREGTLIDGSGGPARTGHLAVRDGRIAALAPAESGANPDWEAPRVLEARGRAICPGFIDIHSHCDFIMPRSDQEDLMAGLLEQGITTVVAGNCGFSAAPLAPNTPHAGEIFKALDLLSGGQSLSVQWDSLDSFLNHLEPEGLILNLAMLVGHGTTRWSLLGRDHTFPGPERLADLGRLAATALDEGAWGVSLGLGYEPGLFVSLDEVEYMARLVRDHQALLAVHLKAYSRMSPAYDRNPFGRPHNLRALEEMLGVAERTGARLQISHLMLAGTRTWPTVDRVLELIESAAGRGVDVTFDCFPQLAGNTTVFILFPDWFLAAAEDNFRRPWALLRLNLEWSLGFLLVGFGLEDVQLLRSACPEYERYAGWFFPDIARDRGLSQRKCVLEISRLSQGRALCLLHKYSGDEKNETALRRVLAHPLAMYATDVILNPVGAANPGTYGTCPRILGRYARDLGLISLEEAVARLTSRPAARLGLMDRGRLEVGAWADLVVFDPATIRDNTSRTQTRAQPTGIESVFINGVEVAREGRLVPGSRAGRVLRRGGKK